MAAEVEPFPLVPATWTDRQLPLRAAQPAEQLPHAAQAQFGHAIGHGPHPFVVDAVKRNCRAAAWSDLSAEAWQWAGGGCYKGIEGNDSNGFRKDMQDLGACEKGVTKAW